MAKKKSIEVGLIGLGYWGKNILRNLCQMGIIDVACDSNPETLKKIKKLFPDINYTLDSKDIIRNKGIKAVVIAAPATRHYELAKEALIWGKDVFVEKPLALNSIQAEELIGLAKRGKRILMVGHILQYHPAIIRLKEIIDEGLLGDVQYIYSNRLNIGKLRVEENILWSFAPHDISVILMLAKGRPRRVSCFGGAYLNKEIYDNTLTSLEFNNGLKAHIFVSWLHPFKEQKIIVVGSKAMAVFDDLVKEKISIYPHKIKWTDGKVPVVHKAEHYNIDFENKEPLKEELIHFSECVLRRKKPRTDGEEALKVLKVLEEAEVSMSNKKSCQNDPGNRKYFVHESSQVDENVKIGKGTKVWHFSHILKSTVVGRDCIIGQNVMVGPKVKIGSKCKIQNNVSIYEGVILEDEVFCGPSCVFTNVYNPRAFIERKNEFLPTLVKRGATIGANATIICGVTIGRYAFVGAGSVVKKDIPDYALVAGVPARQIGWACKCGLTIKFIKTKGKCNSCGSEYRSLKNKIRPLGKRRELIV